jgi:hypothetical protein
LIHERAFLFKFTVFRVGGGRREAAVVLVIELNLPVEEDGVDVFGGREWGEGLDRASYTFCSSRKES